MRVTDLSGSVGTSIVKLADVNPRRRWLGLTATGSNVIYLSLDTPPSSTRAMVRIPANGYYEINAMNYWNGAIYIIGGAVSQTYLCQEVSDP